MTTNAARPRFLVHSNQPLHHIVLQVLQDEVELVHASGAEVATDFDLLAIDGRACEPAAFAPLAAAAKEMLAAGRAVMVLAPTAAQKQALGDADVLHASAGRDAAALLVEPRATADGKLARHRGLTEQLFAAPGEIKRGITTITEHADGTRTTEDLEDTSDLIELGDDADHYQAFIDRVRFVAGEIAHGRPIILAGAMQPPAGVPTDCYVLTDNLLNYSWTCTGSKDKHTGVKPAPQTMTISGHVQTGVYYDNSNVVPKQWIKIEASGTVFTNGPVKNKKTDQIGWTLETYGVQSDSTLSGTYPDGTQIADDSSSPNTANGVTQVTSTTSFSVGLTAGTSGLNSPLSYSVSNSVSVNLTDWAVLQSNTSDWLFFQQTPYDGRSNNLDDAITSNGIKKPPNLSLVGSTFDTQSVWVHQPASHLVLAPFYLFPVKATYCAYKNGAFAWHATQWWTWPQASVGLFLNCGQALPATQVAASAA